MTLITSEQPDARDGDPAEPDQLQIFIVGDSIEPAEAGLADVPTLVQKGKRHGFVWLNLVDPDEDTVNAARETLNIHPTAAADVVSGRQQPKVQKFAEHLFILLWSVLRERALRRPGAGTDLPLYRRRLAAHRATRPGRQGHRPAGAAPGRP